jgi:hypothetical protein
VKPNPTKNDFIGAIIGIGCHIGIQKITKTSKGLSQSNVGRVATWYLTPENLKLANDMIVNFLSKISLPKIYQQAPKILHTSSDGQKWPVSKGLLQAQASLSVEVITFE